MRPSWFAKDANIIPHILLGIKKKKLECLMLITESHQGPSKVIKLRNITETRWEFLHAKYSRNSLFHPHVPVVNERF